MTFTIGHLGDLHLGRSYLSNVGEGGINQRELDGYEIFDAAITDLIAREVDVVVLPGDMYDTAKPPVRAEQALFGGTERLTRAGIIVVGITGNHDHSTTELTPIIHLSERFGAFVAHEQGHVDVGDVRFHQLPFRSIEAHVTGERPFAPFDFAEGKPNVLVAHSSVRGDNIPRGVAEHDRIMLPDEVLHDPRFSVVLLGHIHMDIQVDDGGNAFYPGTLERLDWNEALETPGYYVHTLEGRELVRSERVPSSSLGVPYLPRPFFDLRVSQDGRTVDQIHTLVMQRIRDGHVAGAIGRITVTDADEMLRSSEYKKRWTEEFKARGGFHCAPAKVTSSTTEEALDVELSQNVPASMDEAFASYLTQLGVDDLTLEEGIRAVREVYR